MNVNEMIMAIEVLLFDIRCGKEHSRSRLIKAQRLCMDVHRITKDPDYYTLSTRILEWDEEDGRYFREYFPNGYLDMDSGLNTTFYDKSEEFKELVRNYVRYPYFFFSDIEEGEL
jgi:hypothetical protein